MNEDDLKIGTVYDVSWDDCCSTGRFTSELREKIYCDDINGPYLNELAFANGVTLEAKGYGTEFVESASQK